MKPRLLIPAALAGVAVCALAYALRPLPEPAAPDPPPVVASPAPERPELRHRLADAGWRLIEATERGADRRIMQAVALIGGVPVETPPWYALVEAVFPASADTHGQHPGLPADAEETSNCGGALYVEAGRAFVETAAHCAITRDGTRPKRSEICVEPQSRSSCRVRYVVHRAAIDAGYEVDWAAGLREDRALVMLPDDPGGGARLPQTLCVQMEPGERVHVYAMGSDETGRLAEAVKLCSQAVVDVRPGIVETRAEPDCAIRGADSGSPAGRIVGGEFVQTLTVSSTHGERNFYAPIRPDKTRAGVAAWD